MKGGNNHIEVAEIPADAVTDDIVGRFAPLYCPHCKTKARVRTSKQVTGQHRDIYYQCINLFCGHTFKASLAYEYGIVPSNIPNPKVDLPLRPVSRQDVLEAMRPRDAAQPDMFDRGAPPAAAA